MTNRDKPSLHHVCPVNNLLIKFTTPFMISRLKPVSRNLLLQR